MLSNSVANLCVFECFRSRRLVASDQPNGLLHRQRIGGRQKAQGTGASTARGVVSGLRRPSLWLPLQRTHLWRLQRWHFYPDIFGHTRQSISIVFVPAATTAILIRRAENNCFLEKHFLFLKFFPVEPLWKHQMFWKHFWYCWLKSKILVAFIKNNFVTNGNHFVNMLQSTFSFVCSFTKLLWLISTLYWLAFIIWLSL